MTVLGSSSLGGSKRTAPFRYNFVLLDCYKMGMNHRIKDRGTDKKRDAITQEEVGGNGLRKKAKAKRVFICACRFF